MYFCSYAWGNSIYGFPGNEKSDRMYFAYEYSCILAKSAFIGGFGAEISMYEV